ncbi:MAG: glutamate--tRNA ligase [Phycisphaerae bacterium]
MTTQTIRTRFAPSPTGHLHVGGARTALFNYLLARRLGGKFILRIEDTDQTRHVAGAEQQLLEDLRWLGLQWDEGPDVGGDRGPYRQSECLDNYTKVAKQLLDSGNAYYAFDTREELDAQRKAAEAKKENYVYPRPEKFPSEQEAEAARAAGRPVVIRFKMPDEDITVVDSILGEVTIRANELQDFVIVKADGWPTYHFAVVVDDEAMGITHVLRGQEHLMNTPNHVALQRALGYRTPAFAHLPIILNMSGSKMGKRDKDKAVREAVGIALKSNAIDENTLLQIADCEEYQQFADWRKSKTQLEPAALKRLALALNIALPEIQVADFRESGYLPSVLMNFLALLGWSAGDDREKYTLDELCEAFSVERIGKTNAKFDRDKLLSFNTDALATLEADKKRAAFKDYLRCNPASPLAPLDDATLSRLLELCEGIRTFRDIETKCGALYAPDGQLVYSEKDVKKWLLKNDVGVTVLREIRGKLEAMEDWNAVALEALLRAYGEEKQLGLGQVAQPLRIALTGGTISPAIFDTLELIGRARTLARIDRCVQAVTAA